jgi:hypothetical protein
VRGFGCVLWRLFARLIENSSTVQIVIKLNRDEPSQLCAQETFPGRKKHELLRPGAVQSAFSYFFWGSGEGI